MSYESPQSDKSEKLYTKIDRLSTEISEALRGAPVYKKTGTITARLAVPGEVVATVLKDGREETVNTAKEGEVVVTNPSGEQYILTPEMFASRYEYTDTEGVYRAKGYVRAIKNPFGVPIEISASWGEPQYGDAECFIAAVCDSEGNAMASEPYLIDARAFIETYRYI